MANNTQKKNERLYQIFDTDESYSFEKMEVPPKGWELAEKNMVYKVTDDDSTVLIVGWDNASELYTNRLNHFAKFMPKGAQTEVPELKKYVSEHLPNVRYVEYELKVPKSQFFKDKNKYFAKVRKGIGNKVRQDVRSCVTQFVAGFSDKEIIDSIPDDFIITLDDSFNSGNCVPGTQEFRNKYFKGRTQATAAELKPYAANWNVMRIFRYIASTKKF